MPKRNKPCECGSGKKYKKCCYQIELQKIHEAPIIHTMNLYPADYKGRRPGNNKRG
jgi:SEC-C motif